MFMSKSLSIVHFFFREKKRLMPVKTFFCLLRWFDQWFHYKRNDLKFSFYVPVRCPVLMCSCGSFSCGTLFFFRRSFSFLREAKKNIIRAERKDCSIQKNIVGFLVTFLNIRHYRRQINCTGMEENSIFIRPQSSIRNLTQKRRRRRHGFSIRYIQLYTCIIDIWSLFPLLVST